MARRKTNVNQVLVTVQDTREALRKYEAEKLEAAYTSAVKAVGSELQFSSARHLAMGLVGLLNDSIYTLWDPVKQVLNSPLASEFLEDQVGEGKSFVDYFAAEMSKKGKSKKERKESAKAAEKMVQSLGEAGSKLEKYAQAVTDYSNKTSKTPDQVLRTGKDMAVVLEGVYGSLEKYAKERGSVADSFTKAAGYLDELQALPLTLLVPALLESKLEADMVTLTDAGINPLTLGTIVQDYVHDVAKFGKAFLAEYAKQDANRVKQYQQLAQN